MTSDLPYSEMSERYGTDLAKRVVKLHEEVYELGKVITDETLTEYDYSRMLVDELSDVNAVVAHIAHLVGFTQEELRKVAADKIRNRFKDMNYKREHEHYKAQEI